MNIKGEYEFDILIQNMFNSYNLRIKNHNIVTREGLDFILGCCINQNDQFFGNVFVGTNPAEASIDDTVDIFRKSKEFTDAEKSVENNQLIYSTALVGSDINDTTEIGIFSENEDILITRDVHDRYDIPADAQITFTYNLTIANEENEIIEEEELYD